MAGTAKAYSTNNLVMGPGDGWGNLAVPTAGNRITLHTDGTPDSTAHPSARHVGFTDKGNRISYKATIKNFYADEQTAPILARIETEELKISGEFLQGADMDIIDMFLMGATKASGSGYEAVALGGNTTVTGMSFAVVAPMIADATKFLVCNIYNAYNENGIDVDITRTDLAKIPFVMTGLQVSSRTAGDRLGAYWKSV